MNALLLRLLFLGTVLTASASASGAPPIKERLFPVAGSGWHLPQTSHNAGYRASIDARTTPPCFVITGTPKPGDKDAFGTVLQRLDAAPYRGHRICLRAEVRALPSSLTGAAWLWFRVDRSGGRRGFFDNMGDRPIAEDTWNTYEIDGEVAPDAEKVFFGMGLNGSGQARLRSVSLSDLGPIDLAQANKKPIASLQGPGVIHLAMQAPVKAFGASQTGTVTIPMPGLYHDQVPLDFHLTALPKNALRGYRFLRRPDGLNWLCVATVTPPKRGMLMRWTSDVLVFERPPLVLPKVPLPSASSPERAWTQATSCVQSRDPAILAKARALAQGSPDTETYVRRVLVFAATNKGTGAKFDSLDAVKALTCGGSCTNRANLAAALLRAENIPARTVSHMPAWSQGNFFYEHWLTEYWHPGAGWVTIEPTQGEMQPSPTEIAVLSVSSPTDENKALDPVHLRSIMPGAAYLSACEFSPELTAANLLPDDEINRVYAAARIGGTPAQMAQLKASALQAFAHWSAEPFPRDASAPSGQQILAVARTGEASRLTAIMSAQTRETPAIRHGG